MFIVLIGYMGSGKSAVGKLLAECLGFPFLDLDDYIEQEQQMPITELFSEKGELYFRKQEQKYVKQISDDLSPMVLATGGGTPCYSGNMEVLNKATPHTFYLQLSVAELAKRLGPEKEKRPLIRHLNDDDLSEFIGKHLFERIPFYSKAHHTISCDNKTVEEVVKAIENHLI